MLIALEGPARYDFAHEVPPVARERLSLTWRWYREDYLEELRRIEADLEKGRNSIASALGDSF